MIGIVLVVGAHGRTEQVEFEPEQLAHLIAWLELRSLARS